MMKAYWISLYVKVENQENLKKYAEVVTPIIKSFGGIPLVRGGNHKTFEGDDFVRTVVWEFPSYEKAIECHNSKEYLAGRLNILCYYDILLLFHNLEIPRRLF